MLLLGQWSINCAKAAYFTPETERTIIDYVIKRNSKHESNRIALALSKFPEGKKIIKKISTIENGQLFTATRETIEKALNQVN